MLVPFRRAAGCARRRSRWSASGPPASGSGGVLPHRSPLASSVLGADNGSARPAGVGRASRSSIERVISTDSSSCRSWETSSKVPPKRGQRRLQLLDGRQVEVVGGLVQHQEVDPQGLEHGQLGPGPLAGRERAGRPGDVVGVQPELGQQRPRLGLGEPAPVDDRADQVAIRRRWPAGPGPAPRPPRSDPATGRRRPGAGGRAAPPPAWTYRSRWPRSGPPARPSRSRGRAGPSGTSPARSPPRSAGPPPRRPVAPPRW